MCLAGQFAIRNNNHPPRSVIPNQSLPVDRSWPCHPPWPLSTASPPTIFPSAWCVRGPLIHCPFSISFPPPRTHWFHTPTFIINGSVTVYFVYRYVTSTVSFLVLSLVIHSPSRLIDIRFFTLTSFFRYSPASRRILYLIPFLLAQSQPSSVHSPEPTPHSIYSFRPSYLYRRVDRGEEFDVLAGGLSWSLSHVLGE